MLKTDRKRENRQNKEYIYLNIADLYSAYSEVIGSENYNQKTIGMYKKAFYTAVENKNWTIVVRSFSTILGSAYDNNDLRTIKNEIDIFNKTHFPKNTELLEFTRLYIKGVNASMRKDYDGALRYFNKLPSTINTKDTPERYMIVANSLCAHVYSIQGKNKEAIKSLKKMEELCNKYNMQDILVGIYKAYFEYYSSIKDEKQAAKYHISYLILKDSLMNESKLKSVSELSFMNQLKQVNDQVKILYAKRHLQNVIMAIVITVAIVIIVFTILLFKSYKKLKHNHEILYQNNLETLAREEEERKQRNEYESKLNELNKYIEANTQQKTKYENSYLGQEEKEDIARRVRNVMENNNDIFP
jgi:tetratricopeptide (TPR) repeat protein